MATTPTSFNAPYNNVHDLVQLLMSRGLTIDTPLNRIKIRLKDTMKILIQLFLLICITVINCNAQTYFSSEQLNGTTWVPVIQPSVCLDTISYTRSKEILRSDFSEQFKKSKRFPQRFKKLIVTSNDYYLSKTIPSSFDTSQVDKTSVGNYIVRYNDFTKQMSFNRIIKLDIPNGILILERYNSLNGYEHVKYRLVR